MQQAEKYWAVVPAAGVGRRMGGDRPKQYQLLDGTPVLMHTLQRLASCPSISGVCVGISAGDPYWKELAGDASWIQLVCDGGEQRADTVLRILHAMAGIAADDDWVLVHDAVRPLVTQQDVEHLIRAASSTDGGLLALPLTDTIKLADTRQCVLRTVPRDNLWRALTPQMFRYAALRQALQQALADGFPVTDEASAMEHAGIAPLLVEGRADNIKVTLPGDMQLASQFLKQQDGT